MRIKHFAGYGHVDAFKRSSKRNTQTRTVTYEIEVKGNHEYGLDRSRFKDDVIKWLKSVIKDNTLLSGVNATGPVGYNFINNVKVEFHYLPDVRENNCNVERAQYTISYQY